MDAIILAGGLGTRLQSVVSDRPKPLALVHGKPFLQILLEQLAGTEQIDRVVLATGYRSEQIEAFIAQKSWPFSVVIAKEEKPLGTGGAIKAAFTYTTSPTTLVMNGDSYVDIDIGKMLAFHQERKAVVTIATLRALDVSQSGSIAVDSNQKVLSFQEKGAAGSGQMNAGVYLMQRLDWSLFPEAFSLEREFFPRVEGLFGWPCEGAFIDIGTPDTYARAAQIIPL